MKKPNPSSSRREKRKEEKAEANDDNDDNDDDDANSFDKHRKIGLFRALSKRG